MDRTACRVCGNPVNPAARECPTCGAADPAPPIAAPDAAPADATATSIPTSDASTQERPKRGGKIGCAAIAVVAAALALIVWILTVAF